MAKSSVPTESAEQIKFVARVKQFYPHVMIFAIPNGGGRSAMEATRLKEEGVLAGIPDLFIPEPRWIYHGLFIEMKRQSGGRLSSIQVDRIAELTERQYRVAVCKGCEEAWREFGTYMELQKL